VGAAYDRLVASVPVFSSQHLGEVLSPPPRVAVLDTSVLTSDIVAATRRGTPSSLVAGMRDRTYRGFIAHHVWAEVPRVLESRARAGELFDIERAHELWWTGYLPLLRTVCTTGLPLTPEASALAREDATDVPTLQLHGLIAPAVVLASDRDLWRSGLVPEPWQDVRRSVRDVGVPEGLARLTTNFAGLLVEGTMWAMGQAVRLARANVLSTAVGAVLGGAGLLLYRRSHPPQPGRISAVAAQMGEQFATIAAPQFAQHAQGNAVWKAAETGIPGTTMLHDVAGLLARAEQPMTRTAILTRLEHVPGRTHQDRMYALYEMLRRTPAFVEVTPHHWQLGGDASTLYRS
jgi:hypothetical protein